LGAKKTLTPAPAINKLNASVSALKVSRTAT
jgi:hypothetical protein